MTEIKRYRGIVRKLDRQGADAQAVYNAIFPEDGGAVDWAHALAAGRMYLEDGGRRLGWVDFVDLAHKAGMPIVVLGHEGEW
jgi:hypothetical protein